MQSSSALALPSEYAEKCIDQLETFVINLDRSPQRLAALSAGLAAQGLEFTRITAVDAQQLTPVQLSALDAQAYGAKHGKAPLPGELGCYLSHIAAIEAFVASSANFALILEDDIVPTDKLVPALRGLIANADRWDMVKLSAIHSGTPQAYLEVAPGQWLSVMLTRCTGASAYLINRSAARAYLAQLLPMELPYDQVFDQGWRLGIKVRLLSPPPCSHNEVAATTILDNVQSRKFHWSRRFPMLGYRLKTELQRIIYGITESIREKGGSASR